MDSKHSTLIFFVNGKKVEDSEIDPEWTLLYYLRNKLRLCGTKLGCAEGGCGACTVMVSKYDHSINTVKHLSVNACLTPICAVHGLAVTTVEGIGSTKTKLHPVQERIAKAHGSQCGFCTPGIVMSMYTLLRNSPKPSMKDLEVTFQGNLCRCTGYRPIIEGYRTFTEEWEIARNSKMTNGVCSKGDQCCKVNGNSQNGDITETLFDESEFMPYDASQEPIFPPELKLSDKLDKQHLHFKGKTVTWYRPMGLNDIVDLKNKHPDAKIIVGNTEVGVEVKFKHFMYPILIHPAQIKEMNTITTSENGLKIGSSVTLQEMENALKIQLKTQPQHKIRIYASIIDMLHYFAGRQIRNVAAVGGNIMTSSPISDLNPIFLAANCVLEVQGKNKGYRKVVMNEEFFTGYRKNLISNNEILLAINLPYTKENQYFYAYKQSKRRDDDIAIVNAAVNVTFKPNSIIIEDIKLAFGGMAPVTVMAKKTQQALIGQQWNEEMLEKAYSELMNDLPLSPSAPGGMIQYRRSLTLSLFFRSYLAISQQLQMRGHNIKILDNELSGITGFQHLIPKSSQYYEIMPNKEEKINFVGHPVPHVSAFKQASGEAVYCDDMPSVQGELYMALVLSTRAHAEIISIDESEALKMDGVHAFFSVKDIDEHRNNFGPIFHDEAVFYSKKVTSQGQVLGCIVAEDQLTAQKAARKVKVEYKDLSPVIITIDDAIKHNSFFGDKYVVIRKGNVQEAFQSSDHIIEGECRMGAQEHFYLETQCVVVVPKREDDEMEVYASTQNPAEIGKLIGHCLGIPNNRIVVRTKRIGGGFGGKESRALLVILPAALAAHKLGRPIRCMLDRDEDMLITGNRHPFLMKYKTGFNKDGKITACEVYLYNNGGYSYDLSTSVMERALFHFENSYYIPNALVCGKSCKTNIPSNTAFRGFGGPQGMFVAENMIRDIAEYLNKDPLQIAQMNLYKEGDLTHYNQELTYCTLRRCWDECLQMTEYSKRKNEIEKFNRENRWKKRGIAVTPTKFGVCFTVMFLNQSGALVMVYLDGSVLLTHGGVEMGQGLHTKMMQVASRVLDIPMDKIYISETSTDKVPNTPPTAASVGSDLNGMAVKIACEKIAKRIELYKQKNPKGTWEDWVKAAYLDRVSLSATGFYKTPNIGYSFETNTGNAYNYFTYGTACSVVEVDCLTGDHQVLRTDIVMDLGESLNPAIDIGQIEGAFIQGYGLFTLEEMMYSPNGLLFTRGPGAYKLPGFTDIPAEFNVSLLKGAPNPRAVYASKAVGEPPLFLASSVLFAIREAIKAARKENGAKEHFRLDAPATAAKIRMACMDHITSKFPEPDPATYEPWNVVP